jgi:hypothetical protein
MPGGALLALVSYGSANVILNDNPDFTYYYKVFKRYSHFSYESVTQPLDGPNELFYDQPIKLRAKIPRIGDLLTDCVFTFDLPDIYSKYVNTFNNPDRIAQYEFQWTRFIGAQIIESASFYVGGQKIQEFDRDYIIAKAYADYEADKLFKWRELVGDVPELTSPAKGVWAGGPTQATYPTVCKSDAPGAQFNRPSIFGQKIYVPIPFWFTTSPAQALPLVGLQYQDCEIQLNLRPINQLYTINDPSGFRMRPGYRVLAPQDLILANQAQYQMYDDVSGEFRSFAVDINYSVPPVNSWFFNPQIMYTYAFVTQQEQKTFATTPLSYLVYQVQPFKFDNLTTRVLLDIDVHNPIVRFLIVPRRDDQLDTRNNIANWSNWWGYPNAPWRSTPGGSVVNNITLATGLLIANSQREIINTMRVLADGQELQEEKPVSFFTKYTQFKYINGGISPENAFLPVIPYSLHSPGDQPSGSVNASRIRLFQIEMNPQPLPFNSTYKYTMNIYAENINFFIVESGTGGLKYAL